MFPILFNTFRTVNENMLTTIWSVRPVRLRLSLLIILYNIYKNNNNII